MVHVDQKIAQECYATSLCLEHDDLVVEPQLPSTSIVVLVDLDPIINDESWVKPGEDTIIVKFKGKDHCTRI